MNPSERASLSKEIEASIRSGRSEKGRPANPRTLRALENIVEACGKLESLKQRISLTAVGILTEGADGGPTRGGLRNSRGFSAYVRARASEQKITRHDEDAGSVIERTGNPQIDADIAALRAHNAMLARQVRSLSKLLQKLGRFDLSAAVDRGELELSDSLPESTVGAGAMEAITALMDSEHLAKCGLELTNTGQVVNSRMRSILLNKRQVEALRMLGNADRYKLPS